MLSYKLIASDLDGTLLNNRSMVSQENLQAIEQLAELGVPFVPASGRTLGDMPNALTEHPAIRYIIYSNGAAVLDRQTNERILICLSHEVVLAVLEILQSYDVQLTVRYNGKTYVDANEQTPEAFAHYHVCGPHQKVVKDHAEYKKDFSSFLSSLDYIEGMTLFFHDEAERAECGARLAKIPGLASVESWPYCYEIFNPEAGKGKALHSLAQWLNIKAEETIAVGDSSNDLTMLQAAGLGLAVANATEETKAAADAVICSNEEHAVAYIHSHYVKEQTK